VVCANLACEYRLCDILWDYTWLYRGVPAESPDVEDVAANGEVYPRRPGYVGEYAPLLSHHQRK